MKIWKNVIMWKRGNEVPVGPILHIITFFHIITFSYYFLNVNIFMATLPASSSALIFNECSPGPHFSSKI